MRAFVLALLALAAAAGNGIAMAGSYRNWAAQRAPDPSIGANGGNLLLVVPTAFIRNWTTVLVQLVGNQLQGVVWPLRVADTMR